MVHTLEGLLRGYMDFHVQRAEIPLLRPLRAKPNKGDIPSPGLPAVEKGSDRWVQNRFKRNPYALGQLPSEVKSYPLHLTRRGVLYYVQGVASLESNAKLAWPMVDERCSTVDIVGPARVLALTAAEATGM